MNGIWEICPRELAGRIVEYIKNETEQPSLDLDLSQGDQFNNRDTRLLFIEALAQAAFILPKNEFAKLIDPADFSEEFLRNLQQLEMTWLLKVHAEITAPTLTAQNSSAPESPKPQ